VSEIFQAISESLMGVVHITNIVRAMKVFSHPDESGIVLQNPERLVETAIAMSRNTWKHVAKIRVNTDENIHDVPCIPGDISQVLLALIVNSCQAIKENENIEFGDICIELKNEIGSVIFSVYDNGCGIPDEKKDKVWDGFFTTKNVGEGTGQGLMICRHIIETKHGGSINFSSTSGKGSCFYFSLPLALSLNTGSLQDEQKESKFVRDTRR
jgi:signal transduction histidine kinase